ncbi:hypothetical protein [Dyadobacter sandarakinus]|nr:hypothetical protein [Dyadobacter sandarakinus]
MNLKILPASACAAATLDKAGMVLNTRLTPGEETLVPYLARLSAH